MSSELSPVKILDAGLALDHYLWTFSLDMLKQLSSRHVLKVFMVADITSKLGALIHGVLLQLSHGLPDNHTLPIVLEAFVRELTKVDTV